SIQVCSSELVYLRALTLTMRIVCPQRGHLNAFALLGTRNVTSHRTQARSTDVRASFEGTASAGSPADWSLRDRGSERAFTSRSAALVSTSSLVRMPRACNS